jgi:hypothetical protein
LIIIKIKEKQAMQMNLTHKSEFIIRNCFLGDHFIIVRHGNHDNEAIEVLLILNMLR